MGKRFTLTMSKNLPPNFTRVKIMSIEEKITLEGMERALKAKSKEEETEIALWANNQLSWVSIWQRTGVKPKELEF